MNANTGGTGAAGFSMAPGGSMTTTNAGVNAVGIFVNAAAGGTGRAALRNISTGSGGTITVATDTGGNGTGSDITQASGTLLNSGSGAVVLTTPSTNTSAIGSPVANVTVAAGTVTAGAGSGGIVITDTGGATFGATTGGPGAIALRTSTGTLTIGAPTSSAGGSIALTAGGALVQSADVTTAGAAGVTATAVGAITMGDGTTTSTSGGPGAIAYTAGGTITLGQLTTGGNVTTNSSGGSILNGNSLLPNVVAGGSANLQAGGVIGTDTAPLAITVTGPVNVNARGIQAGVSVDINGTAGGNTLAFPAGVPGQILFNGVLLNAPRAMLSEEAPNTSILRETEFLSRFLGTLSPTLCSLISPEIGRLSVLLGEMPLIAIEDTGIGLPASLAYLPTADDLGAPVRRPCY